MTDKKKVKKPRNLTDEEKSNLPALKGEELVNAEKSKILCQKKEVFQKKLQKTL
jgi:hypothetical protein